MMNVISGISDLIHQISENKALTFWKIKRKLKGGCVKTTERVQVD